MTFRNALLLIITVAALAFCGYGALVLHRLDVAVNQGAKSLRQVANKAGVAIDGIGTTAGQIREGVARVSASVDTAASTLDADAKQVAGSVNTMVVHVDAAVQQTGASVNKAVNEAINPLPAVPSTPAFSTFFHSFPSPTPTPKKP